MENIAAFKPVSTSPTRSTCGVPERSSYCQSPSSQTELMTCYQAFCVQECPYRSSTPPYAPLLLSAHRYITFIMLFRSFVEARSSPFNPCTIKNSMNSFWWLRSWLSSLPELAVWHLWNTLWSFLREDIDIFKLYSTRGSCVTEDTNDTRPGSQTETGATSSSQGGPGGSSRVLFGQSQSGCLVSPPSQKLGPLGSLTLALWIKPSAPEEMWVFCPVNTCKNRLGLACFDYSGLDHLRSKVWAVWALTILNKLCNAHLDVYHEFEGT